MKIKSAGMKILLTVYVFVLAVIIFIASCSATLYRQDFLGDIP
jgi:hypothetical protein